MRIRLKNLAEDKDRHGNVRLYYRATGKPKVRLREQPGTAAFMEEYHCAALGVPYAPKGARPKKPSGKAEPGTFTRLCQDYYTRAAGTVTDDTMARRRGLLERVCADIGDLQWRGMERRHVTLVRDKVAEGPGAKNNVVKAISALFAWAIDMGIAEKNPAHGVKRLNSGAGFHAWTVDEVRKFVERHPPGTKAYRVLVIFLFTGLRLSDVVRLGPGDVIGERIVLQPGKTKGTSSVTVSIPILSPLMKEIRATPPGQDTFIVTEHGKPHRSVTGLGNKMRDWCDRAGLPQCSAHGLRKVGAIIAAEAGATESQLQAIFGWTTLQQASLYTRAANRGRLSDEGFALSGQAMIDVLTVPLLTAAKNAWDEMEKNPNDFNADEK